MKDLLDIRATSISTHDWCAAHSTQKLKPTESFSEAQGVLVHDTHTHAWHAPNQSRDGSNQPWRFTRCEFSSKTLHPSKAGQAFTLGNNAGRVMLQTCSISGTESKFDSADEAPRPSLPLLRFSSHPSTSQDSFFFHKKGRASRWYAEQRKHKRHTSLLQKYENEIFMTIKSFLWGRGEMEKEMQRWGWRRRRLSFWRKPPSPWCLHSWTFRPVGYLKGKSRPKRLIPSPPSNLSVLTSRPPLPPLPPLFVPFHCFPSSCHFRTVGNISMAVSKKDLTQFQLTNWRWMKWGHGAAALRRCLRDYDCFVCSVSLKHWKKTRRILTPPDV